VVTSDATDGEDGAMEGDAGVHVRPDADTESDDKARGPMAVGTVMLNPPWVATLADAERGGTDGGRSWDILSASLSAPRSSPASASSASASSSTSSTT
jgi:hypothetical protein